MYSNLLLDLMNAHSFVYRNIGGHRNGVISRAGRKPSSGQPQQGPPAWKRYAKKDKALGRQAEATLEMIWSKTEWLTDEHIQGMWDAHRVRKEVVIEWFAKRRKESRRQHAKNEDDIL